MVEEWVIGYKLRDKLRHSQEAAEDVRKPGVSDLVATARIFERNIFCVVGSLPLILFVRGRCLCTVRCTDSAGLDRQARRS